MTSEAIARDPLGAIIRATIAILLALALLALSYVRFGHAEYIATYFFIDQDMPALVLVIVMALLTRFLLRSATLATRLRAVMRAFEWLPVWALAAFVAAIALMGSWLVFAQYPLSMDEFWARADGRIFAHGAPMAHVPAEWLPYAKALQPIFLQLLPNAGVWSSRYLPVNALIQLAFGPFASPLLAAISVVLVAAVARRLMPGNRSAPVICALLLASSSQLVVTAMTPYAMSAHLAFNLAWLWLFLKRNPAAHVAAMAVGLLATGLHQLVFFPLFALPFVAESFISGQRRWALAHGLAIAAGVLAWSHYDSFAAAMMGITPTPGAARDPGQLVGRAVGMFLQFGWENIAVMGLNLLRFLLWQNPLALPLVLVAAWKFRDLPGPLRAALVGVLLLPAFVLFVEPFQGHGWGYRYLHGELGSVCLLATFGWCQMADREREAWRPFFASMMIAALAVLLPLRAYQAWLQASPYVAADRALDHVDADVVIIDAPYHAYTWDLARNSPWLDNRPKRMASFMLNDSQLAQLCQRYRVRFFTDDDAARFGIHGFDVEPSGRLPPRICPA